jgi:hypothetical protein
MGEVDVLGLAASGLQGSLGYIADGAWWRADAAKAVIDAAIQLV